ncbi:hypothetical protein N431DRAFT_545824 [Stipitochalara longipes BDJ]|nr:hypothetical protein N431DRAFT_545824 [Stipitochalara longipes BDJ]
MGSLTESGDGSLTGPPRDKRQKMTLNPNRQKPRITRACDQCRTNHARCTGAHPCVHCVTGKRECSYNGKYNRGTAPPVWKASEEEQAELLNQFGWGKDCPPRRAAKLKSTESAREYEAEQKQAFPVHGSLFDRARCSLNQGVAHKQKVSIFRFGDPPVPDTDSSFGIVLPPETKARQMVSSYFENVAPIIHFVHMPTVNSWLNDMLEEYKGIQSRPVEPSKRAVIFMILAAVQSHESAESSEGNADLSFRYFQAAEKQLDVESGEIRLPTIQARLLQCLYLLSRSRKHQCWFIFGTVVNLIFASGLHRKHGSPDSPGQPQDLILAECQKRVFWMAYEIDRYLSVVLGNPQLIQDEFIDQELPAVVDDHNLTSTSMIIDEHGCSMKATVCQIKLSRIIGHLQRKVYPLQSISPSERRDRVEEIEMELSSWKEEAATFIYLQESNFSNRLTVFQSRALKLALANIEILLYRTYLLDDINEYTSNTASVASLGRESAEKADMCLEAAFRTTEMINGLSLEVKKFKASWFAHFCGYSAIIAIYVFIIKQPTQTSKVKKYLKAAERCQEQIKLSGEVESFARRCTSILEELYAEIVAKFNGSQGIIVGMSVPSPTDSTEKDLQQEEQAGRYYESGSNIGVVDKLDRWGFWGLTGY